MANLTPQGGNADLAGKTVTTIDGYEVTYDAAGFARRSVSPDGVVKQYDALGNQVGYPTALEVSPAVDPNAPVLPVSTQMPISDVLPRSSLSDFAPPITAADQANEDAIARIEARRAASADSPYTPPTPQDNIASLKEAGFGPAPETAADQANIDAINRIEANRAGAVTSDDPETAAVLAAQQEADTVVAEQNQTVDDQDPFEAARVRAEEENNNPPDNFGTPEDLGVEPLSDAALAQQEKEQAANRQALQSEDQVNAASEAAFKQQAKEQAAYAARYKSPSNADWRVRLVLAEGATYLYKDWQASQGILAPLAKSNGVIFPYTPQIQTAYTANYDKYDLTHSNYRGYFYKNSAVNDININAMFTAQDTAEAQYLLAVIHFFRSVTKMFYGQDPLRGAPPPIVYLVGLGEFQFNGHACLVSNFQYNLPSDVDYIRATNPNDYGSNMLNRVSPTSATSSLLPPSINRLANAIDKFGSFLKPGALTGAPQSNDVPGTVTNSNRATYVPTKIELNITLLPVQTRSQVSKQFSNREFANGNLLKGGFW